MILGSFFLLLIYLVIALISYGVSVVLLSYVEIGKLGCNTILPFTLSSTDCQYLTAGSVLVLSIVTVMCKSWKESVTDKYVVFFISTFVYFLFCITSNRTALMIKPNQSLEHNIHYSY